MKNELGIEVKCDNCYLKFDCNLPIENACRINGQHLSFMPSIEACSTRIKELQKVMREEADAIDLGVSALNKHYEEQIQRLQEQQFTEKELNSLQVALILAKDEFDFTPADNLLKKIEQTLKNSEANLKEQEQTTEKVF